MEGGSRRSGKNGGAGNNGNGPVRCAIYTRKSTAAGLEQEFNSLDAQWEACQAYIRSQAANNWQLLDEHYDDGGFTGANTDRPAFQRLLADVEAGRIDVVVVYKVDRLSRSLLDFAQVMDRLNRASSPKARPSSSTRPGRRTWRPRARRGSPAAPRESCPRRTRSFRPGWPTGLPSSPGSRGSSCCWTSTASPTCGS